MRFNPLLDVLVEVGYRGHSMRCVARRRPGGTFSASLEVREGDYRAGNVLFDGDVPHWFVDADSALDRAMREGRRLIEDRLNAAAVEAFRKRGAA